jgi:hypothetical protein
MKLKSNPIVTQPEFDADLYATVSSKNFVHFRYPKQQNHMQIKNTTRTTVPLIDRHMPEAENDFLRWQFGIHTLRIMERPVYAGRVVVGTEPIRSFTTVFHILGYGTTKARALSMARAALERLNLESQPA